MHFLDHGWVWGGVFGGGVWGGERVLGGFCGGGGCWLPEAGPSKEIRTWACRAAGGGGHFYYLGCTSTLSAQKGIAPFTPPAPKTT